VSPELQAIARRLEEIEKQVAHLAAIVTEHSDPDRTVTAQSFVVRDEHGKRRAELGMVIPVDQTEPRPWLGLFDANGRLRAGVGVDAEGAWLELYGAKDQPFVEVNAGQEGPTIRLFDSTKKARLVVTVSPSGEPSLLMHDANGKLRVGLEIASTGEPSLIMYDGNAEPRLDLSVENRGPQLRFRDDDKGPWSSQV